MCRLIFHFPLMQISLLATLIDIVFPHVFGQSLECQIQLSKQVKIDEKLLMGWVRGGKWIIK